MASKRGVKQLTTACSLGGGTGLVRILALEIFHDELDLAPGKMRLKQGGGHAGHNGLRSIQAHLGAEYARVRLGIGHPGHKDAVAGFVLRDFAKADQDWLAALLNGIGNGAAHLASGDGSKFMNAVALQTAPPRLSKYLKPKPSPALNPKPVVEDTRIPMQRLLDKFK